MEGREKLPKVMQKDLGVDSVSRDNIEVNKQKKEVIRGEIDDLAYEIRRLGAEMASVTEDFPGDPKYQAGLDSFLKMISERQALKDELQKAYDEYVISSYQSQITDQSATTDRNSLSKMEGNLN